jgi:hypothetical protein
MIWEDQSQCTNGEPSLSSQLCLVETSLQNIIGTKLKTLAVTSIYEILPKLIST